MTPKSQGTDGEEVYLGWLVYIENSHMFLSTLSGVHSNHLLDLNIVVPLLWMAHFWDEMFLRSFDLMLY